MPFHQECSKALRSGGEVQQSSVTLDSGSVQPLLERELDRRDQCSQSSDVTEWKKKLRCVHIEGDQWGLKKEKQAAYMLEKVIRHGSGSVCCRAFRGGICIWKVQFNQMAEIIEKWVIVPFLMCVSSACSAVVDQVVIVIIVVLRL